MGDRTIPHYNYICRDCDLEVEEFQRMSDEKLGQCPGCASVRYERLISTPNVVMKGSTPDANTLTRQAHGLGRDEQIFENPRSGETLHLTGSKKERHGQIARSLEKAGYAVDSTKDVSVPNL